MPTTTKKTNLALGIVRTSDTMFMPATKKRTNPSRGTMRAPSSTCVQTKWGNSIRKSNSFSCQGMITPKEMREEIKRISKDKIQSRVFLQEIGVVFKKNGKIEVKHI